VNPSYAVAALSSVLFGAADLAGGIAAKRANAMLVTFTSGFAAVAIMLVGLPFVRGTPTSADLLWGVAAGLCGAAGATLIYLSLALGPVSVASPVFCVIGLSTPVLAGVLMGERPSPIAWGGVALALLSLPPLAASGEEATPEQRAHLRRTFLVATAAGLIVGGFLICIARVGASAGLVPLLVARGAALAAFALVFVVTRRPFVMPAGPRATALAAGALDACANVSYWIAVQSAPMALVAAIVSLAPATTVLLGRWLLHEPWTRMQQFGLALALIAGVLISTG
jgi:drug/metabolite transporter (DMT)-like permease